MPPEPLPWGDRKDFFRDRRLGHGRPSDSSYVAGPRQPPPPPPPGARWRDSYGSRGEFSRWAFAPDYRRSPGHGKQGGWLAYPEESPYGYSIPRSGNRYLEDEGYMPFGPRADGRYARDYRDNRVSFSQREWREPPWENNHHQHGALPSASSVQYEVNDHRSVDHALMRDSPHSGSLRTPNEHHSKHHYEASKPSEGNCSGMTQRIDKDTSMGTDWRPLKWSRAGSLTFRGPESSHSSSSRSIARESSGTRAELYPQNDALLESLQGDPSARATSETLSDETRSKKKPRLGWGEGLAKYEKKKVEGPDDNSNKVAEISFVHDAELPRSVFSCVVDKSPKIEELAVCTSPTSPPFVAGPSSPAKEDKRSKMVADVEIDANNICTSPLTGPDIQNYISPFILKELDPSTVANLNSMLVELLQYEDLNHVSSEFVKTSAQDRLMLWKRDITKVLELTESEIDSLENELKSFRSKSGMECLSLVSSGSLSIVCAEQSQRQLNVILGPPSMEVPSGEDILEIIAPCGNATGITHTEHKGHIVDSPTVASNVDEPSPLKKSEFHDQQKNICSPHIVDVDSENRECGPLVSNCYAEKLEGSSSIASSMMVQEKGGLHNESNECPIIGDNDALGKILASNRATSVKASEAFLKWLPTFNYCAYNVTLDGVPSPKTKLLIKNKVLQRKRFLKFKEKVTYLKYRAFLNLWKEDLRLLTARKQRAKSQKKFDQSWILHKEHKRCRSSVRSRNSTPGSLSKTDIVTSTSNLISGSQIRLSRDNLKMPALILDEKERMLSRFISGNGLVEDPCAVEKERALINPWTTEEKEIFIDKLANFGKDFNKIANFLDHKTVADCIEFYYKNHKSEAFERTKRKPELKKLEKSFSANTYLVTSGKKWGRELNSVSLDLLGEASAIAACEGCNLEPEKLGPGRCSDKLRVFSGSLEKSSSYDVEDEREATAADVLAGICGSLSSEAVSSCITSLADPGEGCQNLQSQRFSLSSMCPLTPELSQNIDEGTCSDESCCEIDPVDWTDEEKTLFVQAFTTYGRDFVLISRRVQTKSRDQCKVFFSKARKCLGLDMTFPGPGGEQNPVNDDANSGGIDSDNACVVEASSVVSSDKSVSRMDEDLLVCTSGKKHEEITYKARDLLGEMKLVDFCDLKGNYESDVASFGKPMVYNGEKSGTVQNEGNKVDVALGAEEEESIVGHDASKVDAVSGVLGVSGPPSVSVASMVNNLTSEVAAKNRDPELVNKHKADQEISSAENDGETSEGNVNNQSAGIALHQLLSGPSSSGHHVSSPLGLSIRSEVNRNVQSLEISHMSRCSDASTQNSVAQLNLQPGAIVHSNESESQQPRKLATNMAHMNGDVKLFGQILSKPLSVCKLPSKVSGKVDNGMTNSSSFGLLDLKGSIMCNLNGESTVPRFDNVGDMDNKNNPLKACGFRDGSMIMSNLSLPSSTGEQEQQTVNTKESKFNGASVFSLREHQTGNKGVMTDDKEAPSPKLLQGQDLLVGIQKDGDDGFPRKRADDREVLKLNVVKVQASGSNGALEALKLHLTKSHSTAVATVAVAAGNVNGSVVQKESWRGHQVGR